MPLRVLFQWRVLALRFQRLTGKRKRWGFSERFTPHTHFFLSYPFSAKEWSFTLENRQQKSLRLRLNNCLLIGHMKYKKWVWTKRKMSVHGRALLFPRCPWMHHLLPPSQVRSLRQTTPLCTNVSQESSSSHLLPGWSLSLASDMVRWGRGVGGVRWRAETWGGVSVRLARFVLSLFVLKESYERLPRRLALQRVEMDWRQSREAKKKNEVKGKRGRKMQEKYF